MLRINVKKESRMKQYTNIFIIIGVIVLVCGQIQGSEEAAYTAGRREGEIEEFKRKIHVERDRAPEEYNLVNFHKVFLEGEELKRLLLMNYYRYKVLSEDAYFYLWHQLEEAETLLANSVIDNSVRLAGEIIEYVGDIENYIDELIKSEDPFSLNIDRVMDTITAKINPRLDSALQKGLFVDRLLESKVSQEKWDTAKDKTVDLMNKVATLFGKLVEYIKVLNEKSRKEKDEKLLKIAHFDITVSALQVMDKILNNLYSKLSKIFVKDTAQIAESDEFIGKQNGEISNLKVALYDIYEVRRESVVYDKYGKLQEGRKIAIGYYYTSPLPGLSGFYYSDSRNDSLANIKPSVGVIEKERISQKEFIKRTIALGPSVFKEKMGKLIGTKFGMQMVAILARVMTKRAAEGLGQERAGVPAKLPKRTTEEDKLERTREEIQEIEWLATHNMIYRIMKKSLLAIPYSEAVWYKIWKSEIEKAVEIVGQAVRTAIRKEATGKLGAINEALAAIPGEVKKAIPVEAVGVGVVVEAMKKGRKLALQVVNTKLKLIKPEDYVNLQEFLEEKALEEATEEIKKGIKQEAEGKKGAIDKSLGLVRQRILEMVEKYSWLKHKKSN